MKTVRHDNEGNMGKKPAARISAGKVKVNAKGGIRGKPAAHSPKRRGGKPAAHKRGGGTPVAKLMKKPAKAKS